MPAETQPVPSTRPAPRRVAVVGGGISGLAAAHRLLERDPALSVVLFEASDRLGGILETVRRDGWLIERAADMFTTREPWALDLCRRVGLADELLETDARFRRAFVVHRGRLVPVPPGFTLLAPAKIWPVLATPLLSPWGKLRLACEWFIPSRQGGDESLEAFAVRRFGREAFDRLIQPLIGGIYTADPAKLSMAATLPQFLEMERTSGSLIRAMRRRGGGEPSPGTAHRKPPSGPVCASGARYGMFVAPRGGMQQLVDTLAARLPAGCVRLPTGIERIESIAGSAGGPAQDAPRGAATEPSFRWRLWPRGQSPEEFDGLILATPAPVSAGLLQGVDDELARLIASIPHAGCSVAVLGVRRDQIAHPLDGFGFVVPAVEGRQILAGSMASVKFPGRAPEGKVLLRVFVGGALQPELNALGDDQVRGLVLRELGELIGLRGDPEFFDVVRWLGAMPQYHVGHLDLASQIESRAAAIPQFALAGNAYRGVGIPFCVRSGEAAAERIVAALADGSRA